MRFSGRNVQLHPYLFSDIVRSCQTHQNPQKNSSNPGGRDQLRQGLAGYEAGESAEGVVKFPAHGRVNHP
jgi:hypothetical protein